MTHNLYLITKYYIYNDEKLTCDFYLQYQDDISDNPILSYRFDNLVYYASKKLNVMEIDNENNDEKYFTSFYSLKNDGLEQFSFEYLEQLIDDLQNSNLEYKTNNLEIVTTLDKIKINNLIIAKCDNIIDDLAAMFKRMLNELIVMNNNNAIEILEKIKDQQNMFEYYPYKFSLEHLYNSKYTNDEFKNIYKKVILDHLEEINTKTAKDAIKLVKHATNNCCVS